jgi:hypothetical protein
MHPLQIKRSRNTSNDPRKNLRAHVDQLPIEQQREFVALAFQLIVARLDASNARDRTGHRRLQETKQ